MNNIWIARFESYRLEEKTQQKNIKTKNKAGAKVGYFSTVGAECQPHFLKLATTAVCWTVLIFYCTRSTAPSD